MATQTKLITPKTVVQLVIVLFVFPFMPMIISGEWGWWEAWAYALINILGFVLSRRLASRRHPDILTERAESMEMQDAKSWDKTLAPLLALGPVVVTIVIGLDKLFDWTTLFTLNARIAALIAVLLGYILGSWALIENKFFSGVVRIQSDRGHQVVSNGPYRFIRHPGYAGAFWMYLATPVLLDSVWAFIPTLLLIGVLFLRTSLEDRTLQEELPGYKEFTRQTRYRLFPGIW
ncbi:MAG: isoprenylcysteine carboxylmethyltransferase family protein [Anaerolineales bacterium]|nr:isoprenylcysteine carboxylmethyltransferase family protein [Anaerolineales bacterium]